MRLASVIFFLSASVFCRAQSWQNDQKLLLKKEVEVETQTSKQRKKITTTNFLYSISMGFYQKHLSPQIGANCIYETTCSRFSRQLVDEFGMVKGFFLSLDRVGRCNKLAYVESSPLRLNKNGKVIEHVKDFRLNQ